MNIQNDFKLPYSEGRVKPCGWLEDYIGIQLKGLTGNMAAAGFPFDINFWGNEMTKPYEGVFWWPFEQTAYFIDGYIRAAVLSGDREHIKKAEKYIYQVIDNPDEDGYVGHPKLKEFQDNFTRWSHVVFFRACLALYDYNKDRKIIDTMVRHYLGHKFNYAGMRNVFNVEIMLELYRITGKGELLKLARDTYDTYNATTNDEVQDKTISNTQKLFAHGVSYHEYAKLGAMLYRETGEKKYLNASVGAYKKIERRYLLPGCCASSTEKLTSNLYDEGYETCDISDMSWTLHYLAEITDDTKYSDMIEDCVFNAGIGSVTEDFKGLQYFSSANQIYLTEQSSTAIYDRGGKAMAYSPNPFTACCPGNVNRIMPNYILSMWSVEKDTVTARMYGPSKFEGKINGKNFSIIEKTNYPFDFEMNFQVKTETPFVLRLRIPRWNEKLSVSGCEYKIDNGYAVINIEKDIDFSFSFTANIEEKHSQNGVYYKRGPIVYSLGMKGERSHYANTVYNGEDFPSYRMKPNKKWNYAIDTSKPVKYIAGKNTKWDIDNDIPHLEVHAKEVENWNLRKVDKFKTCNWEYKAYYKFEKRTFTPRLPKKGCMRLAQDEQIIKLYPYGASKLRMTVLPIADDN